MAARGNGVCIYKNHKWQEAAYHLALSSSMLLCGIKMAEAGTRRKSRALSPRWHHAHASCVILRRGSGRRAASSAEIGGVPRRVSLSVA